MAKTLNFKTLKKSYLTVTLIDGTVLMIGTPTKKVYDDLRTMDDLINNSDDVEAMDELYKVTAAVMSRNKTGKEITNEYIAELMDFEDIIIFYNAYLEFVGELSNQKN